MPAIADAAQGSHKTTRSSIRQSLGFASVGKAFADVMNKDSKDGDKGSKRAVKESRRSSSVNMTATASRSAMREVNSSSPGAKRAETPDSKTITRKRASATVVSSKPPEVSSPPPAPPPASTVTRSASLRPRPGASSALPKYRPKFIIHEAPPKKSPSPVSRRRPSVSAEKVDERDSTSDETDEGPSKAKAYKVDLPRATHITPPSTPTRAKTATPTAKPSTPSRSSPTRTKLTKVASAAASSSSSSSSSQLPHTPKAQNAKSPAQKAQSKHSPSPSRSLNDSPLARHSRTSSKASVRSTDMANMSHIAEVDSDNDSEEEDVAMLLAPVAALGAPTPAMPRIHASRQRLAPRTPTRPALPTRAQLSYLSPLPPDDGSPSSRPHPPSAGAPRGSILSWEQIAQEASKTLGDDEIQNMISDVPAPFRSGAGSPVQSMLLDIPESPCLSALNSPSDYGSISQVLLPEVTPSPAVHNRRASRGPFDVPVADGAIVTLLRMQLESAEHMAKERLIQLQALEEEVHNIKQERLRDAELLSVQVGNMENELRTSLDARERSETEQAAYIAVLENQLKEAVSAREKIANDQTNSKRQAQNLHSERSKWDCVSAARLASLRWKTVHDVAETEMEALESDQQTLSLLLAQLEHTQKRLVI